MLLVLGDSSSIQPGCLWDEGHRLVTAGGPQTIGSGKLKRQSRGMLRVESTGPIKYVEVSEIRREDAPGGFTWSSTLVATSKPVLFVVWGRCYISDSVIALALCGVLHFHPVTQTMGR